MSSVTLERYDTSKSTDHDHILDARKIKPTLKSPPPGWHRPLPDEGPTDIVMVETEGVRAAREHNDSGIYRQEYVPKVTVHTVREGHKWVSYTSRFPENALR